MNRKIWLLLVIEYRVLAPQSIDLKYKYIQTSDLSNIGLICLRGIVQWKKHSRVMQVAGDPTRACSKIFSTPILLDTPLHALSLPMAWSNPGNRWLVTREVKERNHGKNPSSAIFETNTDIRAMNERNKLRWPYLSLRQPRGAGITNPSNLLRPDLNLRSS